MISQGQFIFHQSAFLGSTQNDLFLSGPKCEDNMNQLNPEVSVSH